jgi:hypothetical protein
MLDNDINFNDEIVSIEEVGILDTIDISVDQDHLFYCNGILLKNSFGLPATVDLMLGIQAPEELIDLNQFMFTQLKNRYNDMNKNRKFIIGVDRNKMRLYDIEECGQTLINANNTGNNTTKSTKTKKVKQSGGFEKFF